MPLDESISYRAINLLQRYSEDTGISALSETGHELIRWLDDRVVKDSLSVTTAKCYRRWLAAHLEDCNHPAAPAVRCWLPPGSKEAELVADEAVASTRALEVETNPANSRYASYISQDSLKLLMKQLVDQTATGGQRYKGGEHIALFLAITAMTGLRPMEWPSARLLETHYDPDTRLTLGPVLEVLSLKQSGRRDDNPLKPRRYLLLDEWPSSQIAQLRYFMDVVVSGKDFERWYNTSRATLTRAWQRVNDDAGETEDRSANEKVTFYTARHIFAEEVRRSLKYTRFELAAMLGHSLLTNQKYYGPRTGSDRGFDFVLPRPWPGDAEDIMRWGDKINPMPKHLQSDLFFDVHASADELANKLSR